MYQEYLCLSSLLDLRDKYQEGTKRHITVLSIYLICNLQDLFWFGFDSEEKSRDWSSPFPAPRCPRTRFWAEPIRPRTSLIRRSRMESNWNWGVFMDSGMSVFRPIIVYLRSTVNQYNFVRRDCLSGVMYRMGQAADEANTGGGVWGLQRWFFVRNSEIVQQSSHMHKQSKIENPPAWSYPTFNYNTKYSMKARKQKFETFVCISLVA